MPQPREIEKKLRTWLTDEEYFVKTQTNPSAAFILIASNPAAGISVTISQNAKHSDRIEITSQMMFGEYVKKINELPKQEREDFFWNLRFSLVTSDVIFAMVPPENPQSVVVMKNIWYDGLTKDRFMTAVLRVGEGALLCSWKVVHKFGYLEPPRLTAN
jgi:hypothetical protein